MNKIKVILVLFLLVLLASSCGGVKILESTDAPDVSERNNTTMLFAGTDDLGRKVGVPGDEDVPEYDGNRKVGVFYFLWQGASSVEGPYDVSKILETDPNAAQDGVAWIMAGGGAVGQRHWWGESLFGYFRAGDEWVIDRDVQMLTDAGVDFLALDASNASTYPTQTETLLAALEKYYKQGYDVPQITFITKANSGQTVQTLYEDVYKAHPEYDHLWYKVDGKPLMIGSTTTAYLNKTCRAYFTMKWAQWPKEGYHDDAFPWLDLDLDGDGMQTSYEWSDGTSIMSVSVAQHCGTLAMSSSAFYGDTTNHTRSWHDGANDTAEDAVLYGYNLAEQFENAIRANVETIFITGWNEWIATRQGAWTNLQGEYITDPIILVDTANINNSRDIQPMKGGFGDNYYMEMVEYIRRFKGCRTVNQSLNTAADNVSATIDVKDSFSQWNDVPAYYLDYAGDTADRDAKGFGKLTYTDTTGRNDIYKMKMTHDQTNLYCYVETVDPIVDMGSEHCMTLFLSVGTGANDWCGYDYVINRLATSGGKLVVEKRTQDGWTSCGKVAYRQSGNMLQLAIPLEMLGLDGTQEPVIQFKWADNYQGEDDVWSFYLNGDAAPYGRLNYLYAPLQSCTFRRESRAETEKRPSPDGLKIKKWTLLGDWRESRINDMGVEDASYGPSRAFDKNEDTAWNPCATDKYGSGEGIMYELNGTYTLESITCTLGTNPTYFNIYISADGLEYRQVATVDSSTAGQYYSGSVCTVPLTDADGAKFVKLEFTGSASNTLWINFREIVIREQVEA